MKNLLAKMILAAALMATSTPVVAQEKDVPYWASINSPEVNMRVGPSTTYQIDWVYAREGLPVKVLRVNQGWRYVEDPEGARGWMVGRMLSRDRGAIVTGEEPAAMRAEPMTSAELLWNVEPGVTGMLGDCEANWCEFDVAGRKGWIEEGRLWGAGEP